MSQKIMLVAGEVSGDQHGARLIKAIRDKNPNLSFFGIGGNEMQNAGMELIIHAKQLSVVGIFEVLSKARNILDAMKTAKQLLYIQKPDLLILIDFPDFNLSLAQTAKKLKIPILYYISPQIWAWRSGRVKVIKKLVDHMAVILPFETDFYKKADVPVTFVGHPLMEHLIKNPVDIENTALYQKITDKNLSEKSPVVALLPGSREGEISRLLPIMAQAADMISSIFPKTLFLIPPASSVDPNQIKTILNNQKFENSPKFEICLDGVNAVFNRSNMVIVASGTATLETALAQKPMIIIYKISPMSYLLGKLLIRVKHIGLANLVAGYRVVPELIQNQATPEEIANISCNMLQNPEILKRIRNRLAHLRNRLGTGFASEKTAQIALQMLSGIAAP